MKLMILKMLVEEGSFSQIFQSQLDSQEKTGRNPASSEDTIMFGWLLNNSVSIRTQGMLAVGTGINTTGQLSIHNEIGQEIMT